MNASTGQAGIFPSPGLVSVASCGSVVAGCTGGSTGTSVVGGGTVVERGSVEPVRGGARRTVVGG